MSADEHLNQTQFFHATDARLKPGELIVPRSDPRHPDFHPPDPDDDGEDFDMDDPHYGGWGGLESTKRETYMTQDPNFAEHYGKYTYRVQPTGSYGPDWRGYHEGKSFVSQSPLKVKGVERVQHWDRQLP
jgi:hypothetical protein